MKLDTQSIPKDIRVDFVKEFREFVSPRYDNHSYEAIIDLKSYHCFERHKLRGKKSLQSLDNKSSTQSSYDRKEVKEEVKHSKTGGGMKRTIPKG